MAEILDDLKALVAELSDAPRQFVIESVGQMVGPTLQQITAGWTERGIIDAIRSGQHIYPLYPEDLKAEWRASAQPYRRYAPKISWDILYRWFEAAAPRMARLILAQPHGWDWLCDEMAIVIADLTGGPGR